MRGIGSVTGLNHMPTNPAVDPVGCSSRGGNCRHGVPPCRVAGPPMQADTDNARTELPKQGYFILAASVAARTSPASNSAPECLTWGPQAGFPTKGKKPGASFTNEPPPERLRVVGAMNPAGRVRIRNIMPIARDYSRASQSFLFARLTRAEHDFSPGRWCSAG